MSETDHETVSYAAFLDYRARRVRAPVADVQPHLPGLITRLRAASTSPAPPDSPEPEPDPRAAAKDVPGDRRV